MSVAGIPNYFSDAQRAELERNPQFKHWKKCPTCDNEGSYWYKGERHECPDDDYGHVQMRLFKLYTLANIPLQFQKLEWADFRHKEQQAEIDEYLADFRTNRLDGKGWEILGHGLGTGKTFAATYILREIVKMGFQGWFVDFYEVKSYYQIDDGRERDYRINKVRDSDVLVLDEIRKPVSEAQKAFYADTLEEIVRHRTNLNLVTIITTNMLADEIADTFHRVYSLLSAKQHSIRLEGFDARTEIIFDNLGKYGVTPIT